MSLFGRLVTPVVPSARRAYSFFSNKSGGGRHFTSAKPPKIVAPTATTSVAKTETTSCSSTDVTTSGTDPTTPEVEHSPKPTPPSPPAIPITPPPLMQFTTNLESVALHSFFACHRPLLLLPLSTTSIFHPPPPSSIFGPTLQQLESHESPSSPVVGTIDNPPEASPEADADAARLLAHALVMNRLAGEVEWAGILQQLGDREAGHLGAVIGEMVQKEMIHLDSVKRKRKRKMSKHKYKKRRKLQRSERRRLGK